MSIDGVLDRSRRVRHPLQVLKRYTTAIVQPLLMILRPERTVYERGRWALPTGSLTVNPHLVSCITGRKPNGGSGVRATTLVRGCIRSWTWNSSIELRPGANRATCFRLSWPKASAASCGALRKPATMTPPSHGSGATGVELHKRRAKPAWQQFHPNHGGSRLRELEHVSNQLLSRVLPLTLGEPRDMVSVSRRIGSGRATLVFCDD